MCARKKAVDASVSAGGCEGGVKGAGLVKDTDIVVSFFFLSATEKKDLIHSGWQVR